MIWTNFVQSREKDTRKMFNSFQDGIGFGLSCPFRNRFICIYKIYHSQYTKYFEHLNIDYINIPPYRNSH